MSAFNQYDDVKMYDVNVLADAICEVQGWNRAEILVDEDNKLDLFGYHGKNRTLASGRNKSPKCSIAVPGSGRSGHKNLVGGASNDLGFSRNADGQIVPIISDHDSGTYNQCWMDKVRSKYSEKLVEKNAAKKGYKIKKTVKAGKVVMKLSRWSG